MNPNGITTALGADRHTRQTVTANTTPAAITWPTADNPNAEVQIYMDTPNGEVELVFDSGSTGGDGITIPGSETNYGAGRWKINSDDRPSHVHAAASTACDILMLIYE